MKKNFFILLILVIVFSSFISSSNIGLIENQTWQGNLSGSLAVSANGAVFGDVDGDGDLDMISVGCTESINLCTTTTSDKTRVWTNNGTSFTENSIWGQNLSNASGYLSFGDIDNDGDLDLISSSTFTFIYENNGTYFRENQTWQNYVTGENGAAGSVALGDIDNDGDLDLIFPDMAGTDIGRVIWLNNGTTFLNSTEWGQEIEDAGGRTSPGVVDFDNDGDLDLNIAGIDGSFSYINNGTSFIQDSGEWTAGAGDENSVAWGDFDNDGDFDQPDTGFSSSINLNNGSAFLDGSSWGNLANLAFGSIMFGDYDNNGFLDLALSGTIAGIPMLNIENNNGSIFERDSTAETNLTGSRDSAILWGDIDNDGDLDLVVIGSQKVYISNASLTNPNEAPTPPEVFSSSYNNREMRLGWLNGSDNETPVNGLYYNLKLGTMANNHSIISGIYGGQGDASRGGTAFGYFGNMMQRKNFSLGVDRLQPSTTYYWSVQTIDTALKAGNWSNVQSFMTPADMNKPNITLNSPIDNSNSSSFSITFNASVADENITNVSLWGNWTGTFHLNETNITGVDNAFYIFTKNLTSYGDGVYTWMIEATDNATNIQNSSIRTFRIDTTPPIFTNLTNQTATINTSFSYDINATDSGVGLGNFSINDIGNFSINYSTGVVTNATLLLEGYYVLNVTVNDTLGNLNWSLWSVNVTPDTLNPNITINSPTEGQTLTSTNVTINISFSDNVAVSYCSYNVTNSSGGVIIENNTITCGTNSVEYQTISEDSNYVLTAFTNDTSGNINITNRTFSVDVPDTGGGNTGGSGGSGGGIAILWTQTYNINNEEFEQGFSKELSEKQRVKINVSNEDHYIGVVNLTGETATINITSDPIQIILSIGEEAKADILNNGFYNVYLLLNSISGTNANLTIKAINEEIPEGEGSVSTSGETEGNEEETAGEKIKFRSWAIGLVIAFVIIVLSIILSNKKGVKNGRSKNR